jgi:hypothetical protein
VRPEEAVELGDELARVAKHEQMPAAFDQMQPTVGN